jgi:hypothetical protein
VRDDINRVTRIVLDWAVRTQITQAELLEDGKAAEVLEAGKALLPKLDDLEGRLHNKARVTYDILAQKGGAKLYSQLAGCLNCSRTLTAFATGHPRSVRRSAPGAGAIGERLARLLTGEVDRLNDVAKKAEYRCARPGAVTGSFSIWSAAMLSALQSQISSARRTSPARTRFLLPAPPTGRARFPRRARPRPCSGPP